MFCKRCGAKVISESLVCGECGTINSGEINMNSEQSTGNSNSNHRVYSQPVAPTFEGTQQYAQTPRVEVPPRPLQQPIPQQAQPIYSQQPIPQQVQRQNYQTQSQQFNPSLIPSQNESEIKGLGWISVMRGISWIAFIAAVIYAFYIGSVSSNLSSYYGSSSYGSSSLSMATIIIVATIIVAAVVGLGASMVFLDMAENVAKIEKNTRKHN